MYVPCSCMGTFTDAAAVALRHATIPAPRPYSSHGDPSQTFVPVSFTRSTGLAVRQASVAEIGHHSDAEGHSNMSWNPADDAANHDLSEDVDMSARSDEGGQPMELDPSMGLASTSAVIPTDIPPPIVLGPSTAPAGLPLAYHMHNDIKWAYYVASSRATLPYICVYNCSRKYKTRGGIHKHLENGAHVEPAFVLPRYAYER